MILTKSILSNVELKSRPRFKFWDPINPKKKKTRRIMKQSSSTGFDSSNTLRVLSFNVQVGVSSSKLSDYITNGWKHFLPHRNSLDNLDRIAEIVSEYDIVALQEVDGGSMRSAYINQTEYLASKGEFPFWHHQTNRNLGHFAQHSNGLLSRMQPNEINEHRLPGLVPGRGAMIVHYGPSSSPLVFIQVHLALGKIARFRQLQYLIEVINQYDHVVMMGDFNCQANSHEMRMLFEKTHMCEPERRFNTFPSWRPVKNIDHILLSPSLKAAKINVLDDRVSDHLPIAVDISIPDELHTHLSVS